MRFMMFVRSAEDQGPPPQALMEAMGKLVQDAVDAGTLKSTGGLAPNAKSTRVRLSQGNISVTDGPFSESKEVVGGYAEMELPSKEAAVDQAVRFLELHKRHWPGWEGESEIRQIFGPEDFPGES